jgi:EcsC protein family
VVVTQKLAAQAVPVIGALGGAAVNYAFIDDFQEIARAHFTVRRLERRYGKNAVRTAYVAGLRSALGHSRRSETPDAFARSVCFHPIRAHGGRCGAGGRVSGGCVIAFASTALPIG